MKKYVAVSALLTSLVLFSTQTLAEGGKRTFAQIYTDCGLGALIAQGLEEKSTADVVAVITNITWDLGTTAISSNATTPDSCARGKAKTAAFIFKSYPQLEKELALGHGQYLDALLELESVSELKKPRVIESMRKDLATRMNEESFSNMDRQQRAEILFDIVDSNT